MSKLSTTIKDKFYEVGEIVIVPPSHIQEYNNLGFIECNGALTLQSTYPKLYDKMGFILDDDSQQVNNVNTSTALVVDVIYANNRYYCTSGGSAIYVSNDGNTWLTSTSGLPGIPRDLQYANNKLLFCGDNGMVGLSNDGNTWILGTANGTTSTIRSIAYANNRYIYVGNGGKAAVSSNGLTWVSISVGTAQDLYHVSHSNNRFIISGGSSIILTSRDNTASWNVATGGPSGAVIVYDSVYAKGNHIFSTSNGRIYSTSDFVNWTYSNDINLAVTDISFDNGLLLASGVCGVWISHNGVKWFDLGFPIANTTISYRGAIYSGSKVIVGRTEGKVVTNNLATYNISTEFLLPEANLSFYKALIKAT